MLIPEKHTSPQTKPSQNKEDYKNGVGEFITIFRIKKKKKKNFTMTKVR